MTTCSAQLYRRYRAPREDREVLVDPPLEEAADLVAANAQRHGKHAYDFQGRSLAELSRHAREDLLRDARRWTAAYRDVGPLPATGPGLIFLAGHQPQLFHPGVWLKDFLLGALAQRHSATAVNLIIDSDTVKGTQLRVPGGTVDRPQVEMIPFDRPEPKIPYEERPIVDRELLAGFGPRAARWIETLVPDPLLKIFWPMVVARMADSGAGVAGGLGACVAQARHRLEGQWGLQTLEVPQSSICASESFCWFVAHLLAQLPRLREIYNDAVQEYRRAHRIRNRAHPVPNLSVEGDWLEAPLWLWTTESPQRRRLFARRRGSEIVLSDRAALELALPLTPQGDAAAAVARLLEFSGRGIKIRSRALITTLWARLALGDLFLHGIGGAKYDQVTDRLIERLLGLTPPGIMVASATLQLPLARRQVKGEDVRSLRQQLRELTYHPERHLDASVRRRGEGSDELAALLAAKERWVHSPQTPENARTRCRAIRQINEALQPWVAQQRSRLLAQEAQTREALQSELVLSWREYSFCLYPEQILREFVEGLLFKKP